MPDKDLNPNLLDRNLLALSSRNPELTAMLTKAEEDPRLVLATARSGRPIPAIVEAGRARPLYSTIDPERETLRLLETYPGGGFFVFFGFGNGSHILPFLDRDRITKLLVVEKDVGLFKSVMARFDLRRMTLDPRMDFLLDAGPEELQDYLLARYVPALDGDLTTVQLRARTAMQPEFFAACAEALRKGLNAVSDDYTVQTHFGKKWFVNTLANLAKAEKSTTVLHPCRKAMVTAAGPSLELHFDEIKKNRREAMLIATDTSLPALLQNDIVPDVVISIDCQHISYNHFLQGYPPKTCLVLDLASPTILTRFTDRLFFFSSGHPFSQLVMARWRKFPSIDTSGGNVSHAAVSLADRLGARQILLYGADFSFPEGKSYARGTYVYPYFRFRQQRTAPLEHLFFSFLLRNSNIQKERSGDSYRYTTRPMMTYKERLENSAGALAGTLLPMPGKGLTIRVEGGNKAGRPAESLALFSAGPPSGSWRAFLESYRRDIAGLPEPANPISAYLGSLDQASRNLWITLYPVAAAVRKSYGKTEPAAVDILQQSREWALAAVDRFL